MLRKVLRRGGAAAVLTAALILVTACSSGIGQPVAQTDYVGGTAVQIYPAGKRAEAPSLSGTTLTGSTLSLAADHGKVVVLNIWASWCAPCRSEAQSLEQTYQNTQNQGVTFIGIDTRDQNAQAEAFVKNVGITYPSLVDSDGSLQLNFDQTVPPQSVPDTMVIDRQGRIAAAFIGPVEYTTLGSDLAPIIAEKA